MRAQVERLLKYAYENPGRPLDGQCIPCACRLAEDYLREHPADGPSDSEMLDAIEREMDRSDTSLFFTRLPEGYVIDGFPAGCGPAPTLRDAIREAMNK